MKYPESLLSEGENKIFDLHHHPLVAWKGALLLAIYLAAWITLLVTVEFFRYRWSVRVGLFILLILALVFACGVARWTHVLLVLTDRRLIYRTGVLSRRSREIALSKIIDVSSTQTVLGRLFGYGDLYVQSELDNRLDLYHMMPGPEDLKMQIIEQVRRQSGDTGDQRRLADEVARAMHRHQPTEQMAVVPPERLPYYSEIVEQIERLDRLRARGTLSEEEFQRAKENLLDRLERKEEG